MARVGRLLIIGCVIFFGKVSFVKGQDLYVAGFAFIGDFSQNEARYPFATKLLQEVDAGSKTVILESKLRQQLESLRRTDLNLRYDLGDMRSGDSLSIAFALTEESVEEARWGADYLTVYRVIAQILIFDMTEKKVIANFPAMSQYQDLGAMKASVSEHEQAFRKIYLDPAFGANIFIEWVKQLESVPVKPSYKNYLKVRSVQIDDAVKAIIPDTIDQEGVYQAQTAQIFEFFLGSAQQVPLVPYTKGQAIGGKMAARFSNTEQYQLQLPEPDYAIDLLIRPFKHIRKDKNKVEQHAFGAFITLNVEQPDFNKIYLNSKFKNINIITFPKSEEIAIDHWFGYQQSLRKLFSDLSKQVGLRDDKVLKKMTKTEDIKKQLEKFEEILEKCK